MAAIPPLDQSSQLLVLSSYLCLVESYNKVSQHIKAWIEVQSKMGMFTSDEHFPIQLPSLMVGFFKLPSCSSMEGGWEVMVGVQVPSCHGPLDFGLGLDLKFGLDLNLTSTQLICDTLTRSGP